MTMNPTLHERLLLAFTAALLLLASLAYYLTGNLAHELLGTAMLTLVIVHNVFNRRWYQALSRGGWARRGWLNLATTSVLMMSMLLLLGTSVMISDALLASRPSAANISARQVHAFAAYLAVITVSVHLGLRWTTVLNATRQKFGWQRTSMPRTVALRLMFVALAIQGIRSSFELDVGTKLLMQPSLDWWDFESSAPEFFMHVLAVMGLYATVACCADRWIRQRQARQLPPAARVVESAALD